MRHTSRRHPGAMLFAQLVMLALLAPQPAAEPGDAGTCGAGDQQGKCGFDDGTGTYASAETGRGAGTSAVPKCGPWCAGTELDANTPCSIDTELMPCAGEYWCTSTCTLWNTSILQAATTTTRPLTCEQFIRTSAYPKGGEVCKEECLLAELRPNRYPAPTGLGFLCAPGTCDPAVQNRYNNTFKASELGLAVLECPCNWFGADCTDDWVEIIEVLRKERLGDFETSVFKVSDEDWHKVMKDHRPGGVVRVQAPSTSAWGNRPLEQPYALANDKESGVVGEIEVLTGPPETAYFSTVTQMAFRVRTLPVGPINDGKGKLFINPSVAGFFNKHYMFLMDALAADPSVEHVVMIATGAGLSGVRTAIAKLLREGGRKLHLFYGLRDVRHLPYRELLAGWATEKGLALTLVISSTDTPARTAPETREAGAG
eukprot:gnl/TRDRNA2_/TRDRNA2_62279_c0_seq2.p1 gnl/TRDRNA2_/TRDRNA2_62279_c0~~gnl/TRDRNA2_/TRDRNA2_62279_c0_seq2.p1  ORF type:complete len:428 (-),score=65.90 gnl/TRDRNA2_/TRDRNA2_62279_c0_seq2:453-1736(-)